MPLSESTIDQLVRRMQRHGVPGLSVAVFERDGSLRSWVLGDSRATRGTRVTTRTLFQAASISKAVSSVGALRLVEEGALRLDDPVDARLTSWKIPANRFTQKRVVTLRHILSHTAGFSVNFGFRGYRKGEKVPNLSRILDGLPPANNEPIRITSTPGSVYRYSGGGFVVLQALMQDTTGERFDRLMDRLILRPARMRFSRYEQPLGSRAAALAARGHDERGVPIEGGWHTYPELAAAGLWTTAEDLARLGFEISREVEGTSNLLLTSRTAREMVRRQTDHVGLGWGVRRRGEYRTFEHDGWNAGYRSLLCVAINGPAVAVLTNSERGDRVISPVLASFFRNAS